MKILAAALASCFLLAAPAFAQKPPASPEPAGEAPPPPADPNAPPKTVDPANAAPEPEEAPEGTEPVKPADTPNR